MSCSLRVHTLSLIFTQVERRACNETQSLFRKCGQSVHARTEAERIASMYAAGAATLVFLFSYLAAPMGLPKGELLAMSEQS